PCSLDAGNPCRHDGAFYLTCEIIHSTVALTCSFVNDGLPPLAGIRPLLPWKPSVACLSSVSMPCAMRGAHAALSVITGAPVAALVWQVVHRLPKIVLPSSVPP